MVKLIQTLVLYLYNTLPNSPFVEALNGIDTETFDFLPYLNWFIPFDIAVTITKAWLACIMGYYIFSLAKKIIFDLIIGKLIA